MILRIAVPQPLLLYGAFETSLLNVSVSFTYKHYAVTLTISGGDAKQATWAKPEDQCQWYREAKELLLTIKETNRSPQRIEDLIAAHLHEELLKLLEGATLHVLRVIRNVGIAPELPESLPREESLEQELQLWAPEISEDGATWSRVFPSAPGRTLLTSMLFGGRKSGFATNAELNVGYWSRITEVLEDSLEIPAEDEFLTNTIGHLRARNYRLAIVDAVIGLEIVMARYLMDYLAIAKGLPKWRIMNFLRHDFGLTARLSGILDLTIHESWLKDINLDHVLKAVNWRNGIVHRTGRLPPDVPMETVREVINAVLKLARTLVELHVNVLAQPDRQRISESVMQNWFGQILGPQIWIQRWHGATVEIHCVGNMLSRDEMKRIAEELVTHLKARDSRLDPKVHLEVIYYYGFPKEYLGRYRLGLILLKGEKPSDAISSTTVSDGSKTHKPASTKAEPSSPEPPTLPSADREPAS